MKTFKQHVLTEAFTRQHYEMIAGELKWALDQSRRLNSDPEAVVESLAKSLADIFKKDNPRFDMGFFLTRCGL